MKDLSAGMLRKQTGDENHGLLCVFAEDKYYNCSYLNRSMRMLCFSHRKPSGHKLNLDERFISAVSLYVKPTFPVSPVKPDRAGSLSSCSMDTI